MQKCLHHKKISPVYLGFSADSFKRNFLPQRRNLAPSISHPVLGTKVWKSASAWSPPRNILQNISKSNDCHYLMISNIIYLNDKAKF